MNYLLRARAEEEKARFRRNLVIAAYHAQTILNSFSKRRINLVKRILEDDRSPKIQKMEPGWDRKKEWASISADAEKWLEIGRGNRG